jgi:hypothetical protein
MFRLFPLLALALLGAGALPAQPVPATFVYRLGTDTVAVESYTRTATSLRGEMLQRTGATLTRLRYELTLGRDGWPTAATLRRLQPDGSIAAETRFRITADSIVREVVFPDSVQRSGYAARRATVSWPTFVYGPTELLAAAGRRARVDSVRALGLNGGLTTIGFTSGPGDTLRLRGGAYAMVVAYDGDGRLQRVDGSGTTNKVIATRSTEAVDLDALARRFAPTGVLSVRDVARGAFGAGGIVLVDYGRPQVRGRTVWGGTLVPFDSVWRTGANDATHLFTTRTLTFGDVVVPPGMYTLWVQHTRSGTWLIVNRQTGQWGTGYTPAQDLGRVALTLTPAATPLETFTITVRAQGAARGALEFAWGDRVATAGFTVSTARP